VTAMARASCDGWRLAPPGAVPSGGKATPALTRLTTRSPTGTQLADVRPGFDSINAKRAAADFTPCGGRTRRNGGDGPWTGFPNGTVDRGQTQRSVPQRPVALPGLHATLAVRRVNKGLVLWTGR